MSKYDEPFRSEHVDEQIEMLSRSPLDETPTSSSAHLISHLQHVYEDTEIAEQVWARLAQQIADGRDEGVEQPEIDSQFPTIRQKNLKEGPRLMRVVSTEKRSKGSHTRLLETLVAVLILALALGIVVTFKMKQPATGHAGPMVHNQPGLYTVTTKGVDRVNLQTGKTIWHVDIISSLAPERPLVWGDLVFINSYYSADPYLAAVNAITGKVLWHKNYRVTNVITDVNGRLYGSGCMPITTANVTPCYIYAFNASNGKLLWSYITPSETEPIDSHITVQDDVIYATSYNHVFALNADRGTIIWQKTLDANQTMLTEGSLLVSSDVMYFSSDDDHKNVNYLYAFDTSNGTQLWQRQESGMYFSPSLIADGIVYWSSLSTIYAINADTGSLTWKYVIDGLASFSLMVDKGVIYILEIHQGSILSMLRITDKSVLWSKNLGPIGMSYALDPRQELIYTMVDQSKVAGFHTSDGSLATSYKNDTALILDFTLVPQDI